MAVIDDIPRSLPRQSGRALPAAVGRELGAIRLPWPAAVYLLCVVTPLGFNVGPLAMTALRAFLVAMTVPLLINLFMGRYGRVFLTDILFVFHLMWVMVALAHNNPDMVVTQIGSVGVEFLGGYAVGRACIRSRESFIALAKWLVLLVLITIPTSVFEAETGRPLIIEYLRRAGLAAVAIVNIDQRMGLERVQSTFAHPIHYGLFCSVAFSLSLVGLRGVTSTAWRWISSTLVAATGFLALSSGAFLAIVLQVALIFWSTLFARLKQRWWLLAGLFALAYVVIDLLSNRTPLRVFMSYATFSAHNAYWRGIIFEWGMKNVWANPIYGIGLNDWERPWFMFSGSMDNFWLVMAVRYGILGFLTLAIGYALGVLRVMRRNFEGDERLTLIRRAWVFTMLGLSFTLCTVHVWTNIYSFVLFMFGAGMWLITVQSQADTAPIGPPGRFAGSDQSARTAALIHPGSAVRPHILPEGGRHAPVYTRFAPARRDDAAPKP